MISFKRASTEKIHKEVDRCADNLKDQLESFLNSIGVQTIGQVHSKAEMMKQLGFPDKNETIVHSNDIRLKDEELDTLCYLKKEYPLEKFITKGDFFSICKKYNLIYAPSRNYIKDIPEKNVQDIFNRKKLKSADEEKGIYKIVGLRNDAMVKFLGIKNLTYTYTQLEGLYKKHLSGRYLPNNYASDGSWLNVFRWDLTGNPFSMECTRFDSIDSVKMDGLFIAAPKSHFDLKGLAKSELGYASKTTIFSPKDPIAFEFVRGSFVRIITKWGTPDDKSYLDPILTNEKSN